MFWYTVRGKVHRRGIWSFQGCAAGHEVYTPLLTGLGAHGHRLTKEVTLSWHVADVLALMNYEKLQDVILVGHSYAGMIITGVAEQASAQIAHLVYVDAFIPNDGQSAMDLFPAAIQDRFQEQAQTQGNGWRLPGGEAQLDLWGLHEGAARDFVRSKLCDFSLNCFKEALPLPTDAAQDLPHTYIACVAEAYPARLIFTQFAERAQREGWHYHELPTGHDCHVEMPNEFSQLLLDLG
ncbi:MAG: alpha/beta hydrolase [Caldilineaceae bacterium]